MDSILMTMRKRCGIDELVEDFDPELIPPINAAFSVLTQLGAGPRIGFFIEDDEPVWSDFIPDDGMHSIILKNLIKEFIYYKVKPVFDPPSSSAVMDAFKRAADEYEQRIIIELETPTRKEG